MYTCVINCVFYKALLFFSIIPAYRAVLVNRTIDSNEGDPVTGFVPIYQPQASPSPWADQTCSGCFIQPDPAKAYDGTWNAATYHPDLGNVNITLRFTGSAIWVLFILSNANSHGSGTTTNTRVNITLDGQYAGSFSHDSDMSTEDLIYNATVFSTSGLNNTLHEVVIGTNDYPISTFINFDWAIYTAEVDVSASQSMPPSITIASSNSSSSTLSSSSTPSQTSSSEIGIIVGCTIGTLAVVALVLAYRIRRLRRSPPVRDEEVEEILNIDAPPHQPPYSTPQTSWHDLSVPLISPFAQFPPSSNTYFPVRDHAPTSRKAAILQEADQMEIDKPIPSVEREMDCDNPGSVRNARSAGEIGGPSQTGQPRYMQEIALLIDEVQQFQDEIGYSQSHRGSDLSLNSTNAPLPPAYTRH